jgi:hypothetical protein
MSLVRINRNPSGRQLAVFAAAWFALLALWGTASWVRGRHGVAEALWVLACAAPLAGAASPRILRQVFVGLSYATFPVGFAVSHVVLAFVFFLVLTPIGLAMRVLGYDPLARRLDPAARSYWKSRDGTRPVESYFDQR